MKPQLAIFFTIALAWGSRSQAQYTNVVRNSSYLRTLSERWTKEYEENMQRAQEFVLEQNLPVRFTSSSGAIFSLQGLDANNVPIYYMTHNKFAAETTGTVLVYPGENLALNLTAKGMTLGIWDSGFNTDHQEFQGRFEVRDNIPFDDHGTHVAGTMVASGVNPDARGMAYETTLMIAYDFGNDAAEMAIEASEGLILSNHSYGRPTGWEVVQEGSGWQWFGDPSISNVEDWKFGFYGSASAAWDEIAVNAPHYLIVRSAGNDRTDVGDGSRDADGPYDAIGPSGVAKNIMNVGAVEAIPDRYTGPEDVVMSDFSSWGPADDGRVKPEIVAVGVDVFSSVNGAADAYGLLSGTSMSSPNATGSLALLQQLYSQFYGGEYMRAATLKGLAIHSVRETGKNKGPDYEFGFGLMSTDRAANVLLRTDGANNLLEEATLEIGTNKSYKISYNGNGPLIATLSWTDVPANPVSPQLDPTTLMLVNDLDMRMEHEDGTIYMPWILDPEKVDREAQTGDNFRDNLEKIEITDPDAGEYTITISHKGQLDDDEQDFSLIVTTFELNDERDPFYWIGGTGDWGNPANWSKSSGGVSANQVPGIDNPVFFDGNSFTGANNAVTLNDDGTCYSINWYAPETAILSLNGNTLHLNGTLNIETQGVRMTDGVLELGGEITKRNSIRIPQDFFSNMDLMVKSENGSWNLLSDLSARNLVLEGGGIIGLNRQMSLNSIRVSGSSEQFLDFRNSRITGLTDFVIDGNTEVDLTESVLEFNGASGSYVLVGAGQTFNNVVVGNLSLDVQGDNEFNLITSSGNLTLSGSNTIDSLIMGPGTILNLAPGTSQVIQQSFEAIGSSSQTIQIQSSGTASLFSETPDIRFCLDFLNVQNVSAAGTVDFFAGNNSFITGSLGWINIDCADALFPDFNTRFRCEMSTVEFSDASTGSPSTWTWNFGDAQFPDDNISAEQNPSRMFRFIGDYNITMEITKVVNDESLVEKIQRTITINANGGTLSQPNVGVEGNELISSVVAPNYQWYLDGTAIPGANERSYAFNELGTYTVAVDDNVCKFHSEGVIITGGGEQPLEAGLNIYPNPSSNTVTLEMTNQLSGDLVITLYNMIGERVWKMQDSKYPGSYQAELSIPFLPPGIYNMMIELGQSRIYRRIIRQ